MSQKTAFNARVNLETALEELIDQEGLAEVLDAISSVCIQKSSHIEENWQDAESAKYWQVRSAWISKLVSKI